MESCHKISPEEVIAKLKDDGDFDRLRLQIVRKLKDNEDMRNTIVSMVKQSEALNRPGAGSMKPRQLSDAIYGEIGDEVMGKISAGLWEIIRSADGMKSEITETVQSVYNKLLNPKGKEEASSSPQYPMIVQEVDSNGPVAVSTTEIDESLSDNEPKEPPGFSLTEQNENHHDEQHKEELHLSLHNEGGLINEQKKQPCHSEDASKLGDADAGGPPGFSAVLEQQPCDVNDEDPDVPPGFG
ncbi:uncharacterized protein LOC131164550 [Malania oleifera]|uniref:uncharacterized protein LOC131164550 n=1 Tax=Malania oleifera TaxID=397392 RepID=UPI0025ADF4F3|nr:uncharacterized protein LOC131164550 [Malania oleifera]